MKTPNIDYMMEMTTSYLDGEMDIIDYTLDFPYELEERYEKMVRENHEYADLIYECLIEEGTNQSSNLSDSQFKKLIRKQYKYIKGVVEDGFL